MESRLSECSGHRGFESIHNRGKHRCRHVSASVFRVIGQWWFLSIAIVVSFQSPSLSEYIMGHCSHLRGLRVLWTAQSRVQEPAAAERAGPGLSRRNGRGPVSQLQVRSLLPSMLSQPPSKATLTVMRRSVLIRSGEPAPFQVVLMVRDG